MSLRNLMILAVVLSATLAARAEMRFVSNLSNVQNVPVSSSTAKGICKGLLNLNQSGLTINCEIRGIAPQSTFNWHFGAPAGSNIAASGSIPLQGTNSNIGFGIAGGTGFGEMLKSNQVYLSIISPTFPGGEIRGQIKLANGTYNDYDGDGRTDIQVYRTSTRAFWTRLSTNGDVISRDLGVAGDSVSLTVDFDGDGLSDFSTARYNAEVLWRVLKTTTGEVDETRWGSSSLGDFFAASDYDGDGSSDIAVFRGGEWLIIESSTGNYRYDFFGIPGDVPVPNDYDGDGIIDLGITRTNNGLRYWFYRPSSDPDKGYVSLQWGLSSDAFFGGRVDFDGDGAADFLVIRNESGQRVFYILKSSDSGLMVIPWGRSSDVVKLGDYDGDGKTDPTITRAIDGQRVFFILQSTNGQPRYEYFGLAGDF